MNRNEARIAVRVLPEYSRFTRSTRSTFNTYMIVQGELTDGSPGTCIEKASQFQELTSLHCIYLPFLFVNFDLEARL